MRHTLFAIILSLTAFLATSAETDSVPVAKKDIVQRVIAYFDDTNKPHKNKAFDFSIIGGPHYTSDKGFGIGLVAAGLYRQSRADSIIQPSSVSLYANATTGKYFNVGIEGMHIFPRERFRLQYNVSFQSFDTKYWGIGYCQNITDSLQSKYKYFKIESTVSLTAKAGRHIFIGPMANVTYVKASKLQHPALWDGQPLSTREIGVGATFRFDTRDVITNPYHGVYVALDQLFFPKGINSRSFGSTQLTASVYNPLWKGAILASFFEAKVTYGDTPWTMLPTFGGSNLMRGYYEGRYRDKGEMLLCVELRQHVWKRSGFVVWGGAAKIFPNLQHFKFNHLLPSYGIGYRWEFKQRVNIRLDYGFGRDCSGFVFSINEAF